MSEIPPHLQTRIQEVKGKQPKKLDLRSFSWENDAEKLAQIQAEVFEL